MPPPPYPLRAREAGSDADFELFTTVAAGGDVVGVLVIKPLDPIIDEVAVTTMRTWKFKVAHSEQAGFPIKLRCRLSSVSSDNN